MSATTPVACDGAGLFARFAYPPNALGLCGPADSTALLEAHARGHDLRGLAREFEGAWPYLEVIAEASGIADPLDKRVVEAYWIGSPLLDRVPPRLLGRSLEDRFRRRAGTDWPRLAEVLEAGAAPHHNFHVFAVYPWVGLLRRGAVEEPLRILDRCRIRWGLVEALVGDSAVVRSRPLVWTGRALRLGEPRIETVSWRRLGQAFGMTPRPGTHVALHWDWLCDVLSGDRLSALRGQTARQLRLVNAGVVHPGPAALCA